MTARLKLAGRRAARVAGALGALVLLAALAVACQESLDDVEPVEGASTVNVEDNSFGPRVVRVPAGTEVTWRWDASNDHNVVGDDFQSATQDEGSFSHVFDTPGTYDYRCTLHGGMTGRVVVTEGGAGGAR